MHNAVMHRWVVCFAVLTLGLAACRAQYVPKPLPADNQRTIPTSCKAWADEDLALIRQVLAERIPDEAIRAQMDAFLVEAVPYVIRSYAFSVPPWSPKPGLLRKATDGTKAFGGRDPLVDVFIALVRSGHEQNAGALDLLRRSLDTLAASNYPPHWHALAGLELARLASVLKRAQLTGEAYDDGVNGLIRAMTQQNLTTNRRRLLANLTLLYIENDWFTIDHLRLLEERMNKTPNADPWLANLFLGKFYIEAAWLARGTSFAHKVSERQWEGFDELLRRASDHLVKAWTIDAASPEPAVQMIPVAMAGKADEGETERMWFDRAVACELDARGAYSAMLWALRPRWGGSLEEMFEFGRECAMTRRSDTGVPMQFLAAVEDIAEEIGDYAHAWTLPDVWEIGSEALEQRIAFFKNDSASTLYYRTFLLALAWRHRQWDTCARLLPGIGTLPPSRALASLRADIGDIRVDTRATGSPARDRVLDAYQAADHEDWPRAKAQLEEALKATPPDPSAPYLALKDRLYTATWQAALHESADWIPLPIDKGLTGWRPSDTGWSGSTGALVSQNVTQDYPNVRLAGNPGSRFHLRFLVDVGDPDNRMTKFGVGAAWCLNPAATPDPRIELVLWPKSLQARVYAPIGGPKPTLPIAEWGRGPRPVDIYVWDDLFAIRFSGKVVLRGRSPALQSDTPWIPGTGLWLWTSKTYRNDPVAFSQIQIRRLDKQPPMSFLEAAFPSVYSAFDSLFDSASTE